MKNVYQKFICAVILICSQIYMLLYDVKADGFIYHMSFLLFAHEKKDCLKGLCCIRGAACDRYCTMQYVSSIQHFKNRYCNDPCADIFHCKQLFCVLQKAEQGSLYKKWLYP